MTREASNKIANMSICCAFLVTLIHCRPEFLEGSFSWWIKQMLESGICTIAVPFFFLVSGFLLARHINESGWYLRENKKRIKSLVLPYFIWSTFFFIWYGILNGFKFPFDDIVGFYGIHYSAMPKLTALWYVRGLVALFLISPALVLFTKTRWIGLLLLFLIYGAICPGPNGEGLLHEITRCGLFPMAGVFYFTCGMFINSNNFKFNLTKLMSVGLLFIGLILAFMQAVFYHLDLPQWAQYWGWLAIPLMMAGIWGLIPDHQWPKWLITSSFPIYLIHKFFFPDHLIEFSLAKGGGVLAYLFIAFLIFVLSLAVALLIRKMAPRTASILFGGR